MAGTKIRMANGELKTINKLPNKGQWQQFLSNYNNENKAEKKFAPVIKLGDSWSEKIKEEARQNALKEKEVSRGPNIGGAKLKIPEAPPKKHVEEKKKLVEEKKKEHIKRLEELTPAATPPEGEIEEYDSDEDDDDVVDAHLECKLTIRKLNDARNDDDALGIIKDELKVVRAVVRTCQEGDEEYNEAYSVLEVLFTKLSQINRDNKEKKALSVKINRLGVALDNK